MKCFSLFSSLVIGSRQTHDSKSSYNYDSYYSKNHEKLGFPKDVAEKALKNAIKSREFEIQRYWDRSQYFWLFVSALWAAFGYLLYNWSYLEGKQIDNSYHYFTLFFLSCAGLSLSFAWYLVNKGSKFWQENWEHQINFLENEIIGKSYKTILSEKQIKERSIYEQSSLGSFPFSVSKINIVIALSSAFLWLVSADIWLAWLWLRLPLNLELFRIEYCALVPLLFFNLIVSCSSCYFMKKLKSSFDSKDPKEIKLSFNDKDIVAHQRRI